MKKRVIALGFFDGVHIGHAALLTCVRARAAALGVTPAALTFDTHPGGIVSGNQVPLINSLDGRLDLIRRLHGIEDVIVLPFDEGFRATPWEEFVKALQCDYGAIHLVCGHDYNFGHRGEGNPARLVAACAARGMGVDVIEAVTLDGVPVSSTYIRGRLQAGEMETATRFLGHPHTLLGTVRHGYKLGRTLGAPTVNMEIPAGVVALPRGVYASRVFLADGELGHFAVTNVGHRPTAHEGGETTVESYILGFDGDLYDQEIRVEFYHYIRPEIKFDDLEALRAQIQADVTAAKRYFLTQA